MGVCVLFFHYDRLVRKAERCYGMSGDAYHITKPSEDGNGGFRAMEMALNESQLNPDEIGYVNAHGTSTIAGDIAETDAIKRVFGDHARSLSISSNKSMIGHLLGASGSAEAIISVLTIADQVVPPTINLDNPEVDCDLDYVPHTARPQSIDVVLSNPFGFGGTNGSLIFSKFS